MEELEFYKEWCLIMYDYACSCFINDTIDRIVVANMDIGDKAIIKNCFNNKVYVVVLTTDLTIQLKTVYRDSYYRQFMPYAGQTMFRLYKDGTVHRYTQYY